MKRRYLMLAVLLIPLIVWAGIGRQWNDRVLVAHTIDQTGDTAVVVKFNQFTARDGYTYLDSIRCSSTKRAVSWTAPMQVRRVTVAATPDTTKVDTLHADLGTNKTGVVWTVPNIALTRAAYIDSMVARFNAVTTLADTIVAQDSVTYIKLVGLIAMDALEGDARWTIDITNAGNMAEGDSTFTTVKMVCDSMVATVNALTTVNDSVTAAVDGDTVYTITADRAGWAMVFKVGPADTTQDTVHVTNAGTASFSVDTTDVSLPIRMWENSFKCLYGNIVLRASTTTTKGYGTHDSAVIRLYKTDNVTGTNIVVAADSGVIPKTFHLAKIACDTCYGDGPFFFRVIMFDTATDTSGIRYHDFDWSLTATE
jgi:hypothetical protein